MTVEEQENTESCAWCGQKCSLNCSSCHQVFYCNREHQKKHWNAHKDSCRPWKLLQDDKSGRYLVASRDLPAGTMIIKEKPLVLGPQARSVIVCIECHTPLDPSKFYRCGLCHWPMCATNCASSKKHLQECMILRRDEKRCGVPTGDFETPRYDLILVLRCLLLKFRNPAAWIKIQGMVSHAEIRKREGEPHHVAAIRYLKEVCLLDNDEAEIHHVRGAIITNSINLKTPSGVTLRGLFPTVSLLNHSCTPNLTLRTNKKFQVFIHTTKPVKNGEVFGFSYVSPSNPVWTRGSELYDIYYFTCQCRRCLDPTELGTHLSCPKCPTCPESFLVHGGNYKNSWKCSICGTQRELQDIQNEAETFRKQIVKDIPDEPESLPEYLYKISTKFHDKHFVYLQAMQAALRKLKTPSTKDLFKLKVELWEQILTAYDILEPGSTRRRGVSQVEFAKSIMDLISNTEPKSKESLLKKALKTVEESLEILKLEPVDSTEVNWLSFTEQLREKVLKELEPL